MVYLSTHFSPDAADIRRKWLVDHSARLIAIYNGMEGYTVSLAHYAKEQHLQMMLYPFPKLTRAEVRPYPLNLIHYAAMTATVAIERLDQHSKGNTA